MRALVRAAPVLNLAGIGAAAILAVSLAGARLTYSMLHSCDFATAWARKVPKDGYKGKVVWITGASSGIGQSRCLHACMRAVASTRLLASTKLTPYCFSGKELARQFAGKSL